MTNIKQEKNYYCWDVINFFFVILFYLVPTHAPLKWSSQFKSAQMTTHKATQCDHNNNKNHNSSATRQCTRQLSSTATTSCASENVCKNRKLAHKFKFNSYRMPLHAYNCRQSARQKSRLICSDFAARKTEIYHLIKAWLKLASVDLRVLNWFELSWVVFSLSWVNLSCLELSWVVLSCFDCLEFSKVDLSCLELTWVILSYLRTL